MPEKPLLIFPTPITIGRYKIHSGAPRILSKPTRTQQKQRMQSSFTELERVLRAKRNTMLEQAAGVEPEMVLVFETRGLIDKFFNAVKRIPELEWLGELEEDFDADNFYHYEDLEKQIKGKLFFVLSNYESLKKILRLWRNYKFGRSFEHGTAKWRDLFSLLHDIRPWGVQDRIVETGILQDVDYRINNQEEIIPFEVELWFRKNQELRSTAANNIRQLVESVGGQVTAESVIEDISYHSLLVTAPIQIFTSLANNIDIDLFKSNEVFYIRPVGQCAIKLPPNDDVELSEMQSEAIDLANPVAALFDGLPLQNHILLANKLTVDDPDNFGENYTAIARQHGTSMASLIIYGDLQVPLQIRSRLYVRPIMKVSSTYRGNVELVPENILLVDLIHRAVKRLFDGDGAGMPGVAPTVKIINLSIGDPFRVFDNSISSLAKLLDWLSFKYKVLFIVSAGNFTDDILYTIDGTFNDTLNNPEALSKATIISFFDNNRFRKIISPAESINAITVGATDYDTTPYQNVNNRVILFGDGSYPSPISRMGLGYRRSIKPDLLVPGGRVLYREKIGQQAMSLVDNTREPGIKVATAAANGALNGQTHTAGTSNATAILTNTAIRLLESLIESGFVEPVTGDLFPIIAKGLLVHSASWDNTVKEKILSSISVDAHKQRDLVTRFLGYGPIKAERVFDCTNKRVTMIGHGSLKQDNAHLFSFPIPVEISGSTLWRRLTVTLAWLSPINTTNQSYRQSKLWFDFPDKSLEQILSVSRAYYDNDTVNRGTVQHEIFEGEKASAFLDGTNLPIRVNCKEDAAGLGNREIDYAIIVTLEIHPDLPIDIYEKVRTRILQPVPA